MTARRLIAGTAVVVELTTLGSPAHKPETTAAASEAQYGKTPVYLKKSKGVPPIFPRPDEQGSIYAGFGGQEALLQRLYPEIRPDVLNPKQTSAYISSDGHQHNYLIYTNEPFFDDQSLFKVEDIDKVFRQNTDLINGELDGVTFSARLKDGTDTTTLVVPGRFPRPGEVPSDQLREQAEWGYQTDPESGGMFAVVRLQSEEKVDKVAIGMAANRLLGAVAAAKSVELVGKDKSLSNDQQRNLLEALGAVPLARSTNMPYSEFAQLTKNAYGWAPSEEYYSSVPTDIRRTFKIAGL